MNNRFITSSPGNPYKTLKEFLATAQSEILNLVRDTSAVEIKGFNNNKVKLISKYWGVL